MQTKSSFSTKALRFYLHRLQCYLCYKRSKIIVKVWPTNNLFELGNKTLELLYFTKSATKNKCLTFFGAKNRLESRYGAFLHFNIDILIQTTAEDIRETEIHAALYVLKFFRRSQLFASFAVLISVLRK